MGEKSKGASGSEPCPPSSKEHLDLEPRIVNVEEAPPFLIDNKYLIRGYRKNFSRLPDIFRSLFMAHNETWNIWTHFSASLVLTWVLYYLFTVYLPHDTVIFHLKELSIKKPHLEENLRELQARIPECHTVANGSAMEDHYVSSNSQLCSYLHSIANRNFDSSFLTFHNNAVEGLQSFRKGSKPKGIIEMIMSSVGSTSRSFTWMSWMRASRCGR